MPPLPPFPKSYSAEMVRSDGNRSVLYVDGWTRRLEFYPKSGQPSVVISRADKRVIWSLSPDTKTYSQTKMPAGMERAFDPDTLYDWSEDGIEMIDGRRCRRFVGRYREASGPIGDAHEVCLVDAETGMRRRVMTFDVKGKLALTIDYLNAKVGAPPRHFFEMPGGYKRGYHRRRRVDG
jgi:outer membrane lipoprotein-sorting protein